MALPAPPFHRIRLATPSDIHRMSVVACAGFCDGAHFKYVRPYHTSYPEDTVLSFQKIFLKSLTSPDTIMTVAVDAYKPDEESKSEAVIPHLSGDESFTPGQEVVVGICAWRLEPGSKRVGGFHNFDSAQLPVLPEDQARDQDKESMKRMVAGIVATEKENFPDHLILERMAIHPAYWRRGHGKALVEWGTKLAELDGVKLGVMSSDMGEPLYMSAGFTSIGNPDVNEEGNPMKYADFGNGVRFALMEYIPRSIGAGQ